MPSLLRKTVATVVVMLVVASAVSAQAQDKYFRAIRQIPATPFEQRAVTANSAWMWTAKDAFGYRHNALYADRKIYWNDDPVGQFIAIFTKAEWQGKKASVQLLGPGDAMIATVSVEMKQPKIVMLIAVNELKPGGYKLRATVPGATPTSIETSFARADKANPQVPFPAEGVPVLLDPQSFVANADWPVCLGVPFPQGTIKDVKTLALFEDGKQVPAQIDQIGTWHPESPADGIKASVSWARLSFVGRYADGKPRNYVLRVADPKQAPATPAVKVATEGDVITVENGTVKFQVNKKAFRGVEAAWYDAAGKGNYNDAAKVIGGPSGAYVVDGQGNVYESAGDTQSKVDVEESGTARVVIAAEGWYVKQGGDQLCKFRTRIYCYAGEPMIRVIQHTVVTFDSNKAQLADVGMRVGVLNGQSWSMGADGKTVSGDVPAQDSVFLHQYRWNKLRIVGTKPGEAADAAKETLTAGQPPIGQPGEKSDGWFTIKRKSPAAVTVLVRDIWQKFPKEVEMSKDGFTLHFWPKHGIDTWTQPEMLARKDIYKFWYFEQGKLLNLKWPDYVYQTLKRWNDDKTGPEAGWDPETTNEQAKSGNAQGVAIGNEYVIRFHADDAADMPAQAKLFQQDPHARTDANWNANSLVEGKISAYDPKRFPKAEEDQDTFYTDYMKVVVDGGTEYGMWTYADVHDYWDPATRQAQLHRVWSNSHYRNVNTAWLNYWRGGSPDNLIWAAANTDHFMDVGTVNYSSYGADEQGNKRPEFKWHIPGAMYHCKGFTPWGGTAYREKANDSYSGIWGHWVNSDAFRYRYLIEGSGRAWDLYMIWADSMKTYDIPPTWGRDINATFNEELAYYRATWDPDFIQLIDRTAEGMLSFPMADMPAPYAHPVFGRFWYSRLYDLTRDERITKAVTEYSKTYGRIFPSVMTWCYDRTKDKSYLERIMPWVYNDVRMVYRCPDDPVDGYRDDFAAVNQFNFEDLPYYLQGLKDAGINELTAGKSENPQYFNRSSEPKDFGSAPSLTLIALKKEDRDFTIKLDSTEKIHPPTLRLYSPSGKLIHERPYPVEWDVPPFTGPRAIVIPVPKDGETGLYRLEIRDYEGSPFKTPYTDLPLEGTLVTAGAPYGMAGRCDAYLIPVGDNATVDFTWRSNLYVGKTFLGYARLDDAKGQTLIETTLLPKNKRSTATFKATAQTEAPYHLVMVCGYAMPLSVTWTGTAKGLIAADAPEKAKALAEEVNKLLKKPATPAAGATQK